MDLERGRSLTRRPYSAVRRAVGLTGDLIVNSGRYAVPYIAGAVKRYLSRSPPRTPTKMRRSVSRSRSRSRGRSMTRRGARRSRGSYSRSRSRALSAVTRQRDQSVRFSGGRRNGRSYYFGRRVMYSLLRQEPMQIWTNAQSFAFTSAVNACTTRAFGLYTTSMSGQTDLASIFTDAGLDTATATNDNARIYIRGAVMDLELKNTGSTECIIDVYTVWNQKTVPSTSAFDSLYDTYYQKMTGATGSGGATPSIAVPVSMFENPVICQYYRITGKKQMIILPGEIATLQMKMPRSRMINGQAVVNNPSSIPKLSQFYVLSFHGPPDPTAGSGSTPAVAAASLAVSFQKVYRYQLVPSSKQLAHITQT